MATSVNKIGHWKRKELWFLVIYAILFYVIIINRSLQLSRDYYKQLHGLRPGWLIAHYLNDVSDAQWRNLRGNIPVLTLVFAIFTLLANFMRAFNLRVKGMSIVWLLFSLAYLSYLHGACIVFILSIATGNFLLVKMFVTVVLRMISFGFDFHWSNQNSHFDQEKHYQHCHICKSGKSCYQVLQERSLHNDNFGYITYLCYLVYAPLYIAGPILNFNAFASQIDVPQNTNSVRNVTLNGFRWVLSLLLMELMTHLFYYNAFANSDLWKHLSPMDVFIIGYGVREYIFIN
ncbi:putative membrane-bound O-acyltransferase C24H6.01c [Glycine max]|nr:putative membrane-bound O-acyltransferase C24H6.01c [Glycine max]